MAELEPINFQELIKVSAPNFQGDKGTLGNIVTAATRFLFPILGFVIILYFAYGGYTYMTSRGNPQEIAKAQGIIVNALIGFVIVFTAFWLVQMIALVFGLDAITGIFGTP